MEAPSGYAIGAASEDAAVASGELDALAAIELAAAALFPDEDLPPAHRADTFPRDGLEAARREGRLFVAREAATGGPVGFAVAGELDGDAHLMEVAVAPRHGGRGVGRALVEAAVAWARGAGRERVVLTTFRHLRWNAPFYAKLGFAEIPRARQGPALRAVLAAEAASGLDPAKRVAMGLALRGGGGSA